MNSVFVMLNKTGYAVAATYEEPKAIEICRNNGWSYQRIPFYSCEGTEITVVAGPIKNAHFPSSERTLMGDFKPDAY